MQQLTLNPDTQAKKAKLIEDLCTGNFTLSFSSLKEFAKSPSHFIRYKLGEKKETAAMKKGSLIHCAILEPNELENRYLVLSKDSMPNPDADFRNAENKAWKKAMETEAEATGKIIIDPSEWEVAESHRDTAYGNQIISPYLNGLQKTELAVEWEYLGFRFRGVIDGIGPSYSLDLKTVDDASPDRLRYKLFGEKYHWQHFLYRQAEDVAPYFGAFNLLVDGDMGMSLLKVQDHQIDMAEQQIDALLDKFRMCLDNEMWDMNYEFFANNPNQGYYTID